MCYNACMNFHDEMMAEMMAAYDDHRERYAAEYADMQLEVEAEEFYYAALAEREEEDEYFESIATRESA